MAKINVKSLASLVGTGVGGPDASWLIRWTAVSPGTTGNGDIYYVGMDNNARGVGHADLLRRRHRPDPVNNPGEHTKYLDLSADPRAQRLPGLL